MVNIPHSKLGGFIATCYPISTKEGFESPTLSLQAQLDAANNDLNYFKNLGINGDMGNASYNNAAAKVQQLMTQMGTAVTTTPVQGQQASLDKINSDLNYLKTLGITTGSDNPQYTLLYSQQQELLRLLGKLPPSAPIVSGSFDSTKKNIVFTVTPYGVPTPFSGIVTPAYLVFYCKELPQAQNLDGTSYYENVLYTTIINNNNTYTLPTSLVSKLTINTTYNFGIFAWSAYANAPLIGPQIIVSVKIPAPATPAPTTLPPVLLIGNTYNCTSNKSALYRATASDTIAAYGSMDIVNAWNPSGYNPILITCESYKLAPNLSLPATPAPTTPAPTTKAPTTFPPTTFSPTTPAPTTKAPTTFPPTTFSSTTLAPTTMVPTTMVPTTTVPTTTVPTMMPTTMAPTFTLTSGLSALTATMAPTTMAPTIMISSEEIIKGVPNLYFGIGVGGLVLLIIIILMMSS